MQRAPSLPFTADLLLKRLHVYAVSSRRSNNFAYVTVELEGTNIAAVFERDRGLSRR